MKSHTKQIHTVLFVIGLSLGGGQAHAADEKSFAVAASEWWNKSVPPEIREIVNSAQMATAVYSDVTSAVNLGLTLATALGLLQGPKQIDLEKEFETLNRKLDEIIKIVAASDAFHERELRQNATIHRISESFTAAETAKWSVVGEPQMPLTNEGKPMQDSRTNVRDLLDSSLSFRVKAVNDRNQEQWIGKILDSARSQDGKIYDWRIVVPELMTLIALRVQVVAAFDESVRVNGMFSHRFREEFLPYRNEIMKHSNYMDKGVQCGTSYRALTDDGMDGWQTDDYPADTYHMDDYEATVGCVDIYTGGYFEDSFFASEVLEDWEQPIDLRLFVIDQLAWDVEQRKDALARQVRAQLPLFEMRSLSDTLLAYASPELERRTGAERILVAGSEDLCLDVQWGNSEPGTPVHIWPCNGGDAQRWVYDRQSSTVRNPAFDTCLDVQWGNPTPGTPVHIWECNGGIAQKWTFDPEKQVLQNALGTVLDVNNGSLQAGTLVGTWSRNEGQAQRWIVEN